MKRILLTLTFIILCLLLNAQNHYHCNHYERPNYYSSSYSYGYDNEVTTYYIYYDANKGIYIRVYLNKHYSNYNRPYTSRNYYHRR